MAKTLYGFEDGTNGSAYTIDTPAGGGGVAALAANDNPAHGSLSLKITGSGSYQYVQRNFPSALTAVEFRGYFNTDVAVTGDATFFRAYTDTTSITSTNTVSIHRTSANKFQIIDGSGTSIFSTTAAVSVSTWYRWELFISCGTSANATIKFAYYLGDSMTPVQSFSTTTATTAATLASAHLGKQVTAAFATASGTTHEWHDDFAYDDAASTLTPWPYSSATWVIGGIAW